MDGDADVEVDDTEFVVGAVVVAVVAAVVGAVGAVGAKVVLEAVS